MTKTEYYQLPQWEAHDPVRREDFNAAMETIDAGLADSCAERNQDARRQAELLGYNLYLTLLEGRYRGQFTGPMRAVSCNALTTAEELAAADGDHLEWPGGGIYIGPGTELTTEMLSENITEQVDGELPEYASTSTASVTFSCPRSGTLTGLDLWFSYTSSFSGVSLKLTVRLYDLDSQAYTYTSPTITTEGIYNTDPTQTLTVAAPLVQGHTYRLEVKKSGTAVWMGTFGIGTKGQQDITGVLDASPVLSHTVSAVLAAPAGCRRALAVVRYSGGAGVPAAKLNGQAMTAGASRPVQSVSGADCTEQIYTLEGTFGGEAVLTVELSATADAQMVLHDFGGMLL